MQRIKFVETTAAELENSPVQDGNFYVTLDSNKIYVDLEGERYLIGDGNAASLSQKSQAYAEAALSRLDAIAQGLPQNLLYDTWDMPLGDTTSDQSLFYGPFANNGSPYPPYATEAGIRFGYDNASSSRGLQVPMVGRPVLPEGERLMLCYRYRTNVPDRMNLFIRGDGVNYSAPNMKAHEADEEWHDYYAVVDVLPSFADKELYSIIVAYGRKTGSEYYMEIARGSLKLCLLSEAMVWTPAPEDYGSQGTAGLLGALEQRVDALADLVSSNTTP